MKGLIIQKLGGAKFEEYMQENVLKPLNMTSSTFQRTTGIDF